jgi:hypothetical protein
MSETVVPDFSALGKLLDLIEAAVDGLDQAMLSFNETSRELPAPPLESATPSKQI